MSSNLFIEKIALFKNLKLKVYHNDKVFEYTTDNIKDIDFKFENYTNINVFNIKDSYLFASLFLDYYFKPSDDLDWEVYLEDVLVDKSNIYKTPLMLTWHEVDLNIKDPWRVQVSHNGITNKTPKLSIFLTKYHFTLSSKKNNSNTRKKVFIHNKEIFVKLGNTSCILNDAIVTYSCTEAGNYYFTYKMLYEKENLLKRKFTIFTDTSFKTKWSVLIEKENGY